MFNGKWLNYIMEFNIKFCINDKQNYIKKYTSYRY